MEAQELEVPVYLTQRQVAEMVGKSEAWLERSRWSGIGGPVFTKIGRSVRYSMDDIVKWLEAQPRLTSTTEDRKAVQK